MRRVGVAMVAALASCQSGEPDTEVPLLDGRDLATARAIEFLGGRDGQPYRLERQARGGWRMLQPIRDDFAPAQLTSLAQAFGKARLHVGESATSAGLDAPIAHLAAEFEDLTLRVEFGKPSHPGRIWVRRDAVLGTVPIDLLVSLQPEQAALRSRAVFPLAEATALRIERGGQLVGEARRDGRAWQGQFPAGKTAESIGGAVLALQIAEFRYGPPIDRGVPVVHLIVDDAHGAEELALWPEGARWLGRQAHRDVEFWLELPGALAAILGP